MVKSFEYGLRPPPPTTPYIHSRRNTRHTGCTCVEGYAKKKGRHCRPIILNDMAERRNMMSRERTTLLFGSPDEHHTNDKEESVAAAIMLMRCPIEQDDLKPEVLSSLAPEMASITS
ncbi:hypothetical protein Tco_1438046 [Tanacetum coccineum]